MSGVRNKLRQWKYRLKHDFLAVENIVLVVAVTMCLVWTYQSIVAMNRNWELTERLSMEKKNLELLEIEVETAELENEYLKTDEYRELAARKLAGKQLPGEHMVYLPENTIAAQNKHLVVEQVKETTAREYTNVEKWLLYLFPNR
ncbi:hypothetical protein IJI00_00410 [Candidatus Saccharibacteria bacterium]|nr:hypothetical protein [Candidatus Saccharibacteria bacterium]